MEEKLSILTELIKMARIDNEVRQVEYDFILTIARMLEVSEEDFKKLFEEYADFKPMGSEFDRIFQFHRLVLLANVDLEVDRAEIHRLKECGLHLGLRPAAITRVLEEMRKHENGMVPAETMVKIFQTYHN